ncbi:hypothetical protein OD350_29055 (plasmid) [Clostridium beijerinckii]|uniref:hypothetical protein n=1 Tax=Clostridium beijerinckii TaxID=1520 RepID=UPI002226326E|nr:hypothetical protein [Clostridium beijerinckii]UYZ38938.1 hypothetical protein OD350_29055 [Clostridium beijerinckii]
MREVLKDKRVLILIICVQILTMIAVIQYFYSKNNNQDYINLRRLTTTYEYEAKRQGDSLDVVENNFEKLHESEKSTPKFDITDDKAVEKLFIDISTLINDNDFSSIYKYYNKDYINDFKINEEQIKDKLKFSPKVSPKVTNIKRDSSVPDRAVATVRFIDDLNRERIFDFTVFTDGTIADLPLYKEIQLNRITEKDDITYTLKKKFISRLGSIFIVNIKNHSEYLLDIQDIKGILGTSTEYQHELINGNKYSYQVTPQKSVDLIIKIDNQEKPDDILFINKKVDGSLETYSIWNKG